MPDWVVGLLALYGAVASTILGILQIGRERRRDAIQIRAELDFAAIGGGDDWLGVVMARAKNVGLREVELRTAQFILSGDRAYQPAELRELPKTLKPTQSVDAWISNHDLSEIIKHQWKETGKKARLEGATFKDGTGTRYRARVPRKLRKYLRDERIES